MFVNIVEIAVTTAMFDSVGIFVSEKVRKFISSHSLSAAV